MGILSHATVDSVFHEPGVMILVTIFAGMILAIKRLHVRSVEGRTIPFSYSRFRLGLVGILFLALAVLIVRPAAAWYAFEKGEEALLADRAALAVERFRWATKIDPGISSYYDMLARTELMLYLQSRDLRWIESAISDLGIGFSLNPLDGRLANRMGSLLVLAAERAQPDSQKAVLSEAVSYYEQATRLDPYSPFNYLELGRICLTQGRVEEARHWLEKAKVYEPNFLPARVSLAELAARNGHPEVAASEYREIVKIKHRYEGRTLNSLERQYLEVDLGTLGRSLAQTS
jgi:tetratricopeptide (TPR) repeat protein